MQYYYKFGYVPFSNVQKINIIGALAASLRREPKKLRRQNSTEAD
jgi:hypothetical protein